MNGAADLGGMHGFGKIKNPKKQPKFEHEWEKKVLGMTIAVGALGKWNLDESRYERESINPADYLSYSYYQIWLEALINLMQKKGMITEEEIFRGGRVKKKPVSVGEIMTKDNVWQKLHSLKGSVSRTPTKKPRYSVGQKILTINEHPVGHTRLPRYARGKKGKINKILGFHVFPDSNFLGGGAKNENPQWLYQVQFTAKNLWGKNANKNDSVTLDLWEPYLEKIR